MSMVPVDHDEMAVLPAAQIHRGRLAALHPMGLRDGLVGKRVKRIARVGRVIDTVALARVLEDHASLGLSAVDDGVRYPVGLHATGRDVAPEVRVQVTHAATRATGRAVIDELDIAR